MKRIEDKVVSLELAKRMKELGWDYETERWWAIFDAESGELGNIKEIANLKGDFEDCISAPDVIEVGDELPCGYYSIREEIGKWECWLRTEKQKVEGNTEAEARGKMWCYLKEKKLI